MSVYIFTQNTAKLLPKKDEGLAELLSPQTLAKHTPGTGDISYLDISGLSLAEAKKAAAKLKKRCAVWGIADPKGESADPAAWFFEGASDYLGPGVFKGGLSAKRFKSAAAWRTLLDGTAGEDAGGEQEQRNLPKNGIKAPAGKFPGWKTIPQGKTIPVYLLYCSLQAKTNLSSRLGEAAYTQLHKRFLAHLYKNFQEAEGLIWMDSGKDCLFLLPPKTKNAAAAVKGCMRLLISAPMTVIETLGITIPAHFVFSLHYGQVNYKPPGKTGTVVSDAVNFIFHLGAKHAEPGRLTVSNEIPDDSIPGALEDWFVSAGEYEGRNIWHTKKFSYPQPWM